MKLQVVHVLPDTRGWKATLDAASRSLIRGPRKQDIIERARLVARAQDATLIVQGRTGRIEVLPIDGMKRSKRNRMHVLKEGDRWKALWEGGRRASVTGKTQAGTERRAKEIVRKAGGGEVVTHRPNGVIRDSGTIPPARNPFPRRDRRH